MKDPALKHHRTFGLSSFAVDNRTSIFILAFMIILFGLRSYNTMPKEQYPEVSFPQIFVNTVYFGNSPRDIENLISRPLEKEIASISGLKSVKSSSLQDYSLIIAEFESDVVIESAKRSVKDAVDRAMQELPTDLTQDPEILDVDVSEFPIMVINVAGDYSIDQLKEYAEDISDEIENRVREISEVQIKGDLDKEVQINVDFAKMQAFGLSFGDIENAISAENITMSGGELLNNDFRRTVRILGEFKSIKDIQNVIIKSENQKPIYLRDVALVEFTYADKTSIARADQKPVISLDIIKRDGANLLAASDAVKEVISRMKASDLPDDLKVTTFNDGSVMTRASVATLENSIISGVILVILVLLFFLGIRNASFVGLAIPLSMLMGILILSLVGYTLNIMILFGLILALGLLVDNGIVVVENIYRYRAEGYSAIEASKYGVGEVAMPIIASTATTLAAFIPLVFWPGIMGSFMRYLPITLVVVLTSSLFVALVINPVITAVYMKVETGVEIESEKRRRRQNILLGVAMMMLIAIASHFGGILWLRNILVITIAITLVNFFILRKATLFFQQKIVPAMERGYNRIIAVALKGWNPVLVFTGTFVILILSAMLLASNPPKQKLFPDTDPTYINVFIELPIGMDIEATNHLVTSLETEIEASLEPYRHGVEAVLTQIGENTGDPNSDPEFGSSPHKSRITISFLPFEERGGINTTEVLSVVRNSITSIPGAEITVDKNASGPPTGKPIFIEITGDEINELALLADDMKRYLEEQKIPGIEELKADVSISKPELLIDIDREAARKYELSTYMISDAIRTALFGKELSQYKVGEDEYPIQVRMDKKYRNDIDYLLNQKAVFRSPATGKISSVPLSTAASFKYSSTYSQIKRKDQKRIISLSSNVLQNYNANEVVSNVMGSLSKYDMPDGYTYSFGGEQLEQKENMEYLTSAFMVAIFVIFIILVAQFNSVISPFIIILSVLFSTIGVLLGYVASGRDIEIVMSGIGIISLAGIVVNNAIVMVDYINLMMRRKRISLGIPNMMKMSKEHIKEAIIKGGATRLRPVILTAVTTVLGLLPMATAFNFNFKTLISDFDPNIYIGGDVAQFWQTMAWTVIYGLVFATILTLVVVPVMYWLSYRLKVMLVRNR
ncbi:MAG: efflux RND transporter permease subunit [Bacteroidia bacterium]|nr:efflux RND transporter permease subunit [Bacteroidia bacterium]